jgi:hypothetical protein
LHQYRVIDVDGWAKQFTWLFNGGVNWLASVGVNASSDHQAKYGFGRDIKDFCNFLAGVGFHELAHPVAS